MSVVGGIYVYISQTFHSFIWLDFLFSSSRHTTEAKGRRKWIRKRRRTKEEKEEKSKAPGVHVTTRIWYHQPCQRQLRIC
jgi:hypothetical protein